MLWLTKFKTDPLNLVGPNVSKAPIREIDLSGTIFSFNCPPQTAEIPGFMGDNQFDINSVPIPEQGIGSKKIASIPIFTSGWNFNDRSIMGQSYGGIDLKIILLKNIPKIDKKSSLINKKNMGKWICNSEESVYGAWNQEMWDNKEKYVDSITPEKSFWQYPKYIDELQWCTINNHEWVHYEIFKPERIPSIKFATAISHRHVVYIAWSPSIIGCSDFFSSKHNLRAATKTFIDQMMSGMKITLSAEAQKQFDEVK